MRNDRNGISGSGMLCTAFLILHALSFTACSESDEVGEYDDWQTRNQLYVDSIAALANAGTDGWAKLLAFNLDEAVESQSPNNNHYIYYQRLENGEGTDSVMYNDSIRVHYLGRLIPSVSYSQGYVFGKSYSTYVLNEATDVPALMGVNENVKGFATATLNMVEGDRWKLVIPYYLGYGDTENSTNNIPAYSTLIFDVKLAKIYKYQIDTQTTWH